MKTSRKEVTFGKRLRFRFEYALLRGLECVVPLLSRRFMKWIGRGLGLLAYWLSPTLRRVSLANLDVVFGDTMPQREKVRIARASLQSVGATFIGLFWAPRLTRETIDQFAEVDAKSLQYVRELKARHKPIVFITLHYGDWELLGLASGFYGLEVTVVQEAMKNEALGSIFARLRGSSGHRLVPGRFAATTLLKTLKRGGNIALLIDLNATRKRGGIWLEFFGLPVFSNVAIGALALRSDAVIVAGAAIPLPDGRIRIHYEPIIPDPSTGDYDADLRALNQKCLAYCERTIRHQPEFWMWSYKRWTPRATPEQGRYPAYSRYVPDIVPSP